MKGMRAWGKATVAGLARCGRRLGVDRRGAIAAFIALAVVPLVGFIGIGTDTARAFMVKSRLSTALDAAGLAGGKAFFSDTRDADMTMFFNANFPVGYMGATVSGPTVAITGDAGTTQVIQLTASATVPTTFMRLFGYDDITVSASAEITRQQTLLDVVLSIDMSGSMTTSTGGTTRIAAARTAATTLVNILFGANATNPLLKIGLVPWNSKVNVMVEGQLYHPTSTLPQSVAPFINPVTNAGQSTVYYADNTPVPLLSSPPADWQGCVFSRFIDDEDPATDADIFDGPTETAGAEWPAWQPIGPEGEPVSGSARCTLAIGYNECGACLDHGITPLQNAKQPILDAIRDGGFSGAIRPQHRDRRDRGAHHAQRAVEPPQQAIRRGARASAQRVTLPQTGRDRRGLRQQRAPLARRDRGANCFPADARRPVGGQQSIDRGRVFDLSRQLLKALGAHQVEAAFVERRMQQQGDHLVVRRWPPDLSDTDAGGQHISRQPGRQSLDRSPVDQLAHRIDLEPGIGFGVVGDEEAVRRIPARRQRDKPRCVPPRAARFHASGATEITSPLAIWRCARRLAARSKPTARVKRAEKSTERRVLVHPTPPLARARLRKLRHVTVSTVAARPRPSRNRRLRGA